jgi:hypothetical protein
VVAFVALVVPRSAGLVEWNDGRDKLNVHADYGITYDSNLLANADSPGDVDQSLELGATYARHAGVFGFNATASVVGARFQKYSKYNYTNPGASLGLTKNDGRLTGSFTAGAQKESRSDDAANIRASFWHYNANLGLRYPINDRYYITSTSEVLMRDYVPNTPLYDLSSYSEGVDLYYIYSTKLDVLGGYRIRFGDASTGGSHTVDQAFTIGGTGAILPKLSGTVRVGYQSRHEDTSLGGTYNDLTTDFMFAWPMTRRITFNFQVSKDFTTTATDISVDSTSFDLSATVKPNMKIKIALTGEAGYTNSRFLGIKGGGRDDRTYSFLLKMSVPIKTHFAASLSCGFLTNGSSFDYAVYDRFTTSLTLSAHY